MTDTFKVGDKVQHDDKTATVAGGPHMGYSKWYVVEDADGKEYPVGADRLTLVPTDPRRDVVARAIYDHRYPLRTDGDQEHRLSVFRGDADAILAALDAMEAPAEEPRPLVVGDMVRITRENDPEYESPGARTGRIGPLVAVYPGDHDYPYTVNVSGYGDCMSHSVERVTDADVEVIDGVTYDLGAKYKDQDGDVWRLRRVSGVVRATMNIDETEFPDEDSRTLAHAIEAYGPLTRI
ncbi:phiSA1p31-related protein [Streptomyces asiaticus]|uniref:phiSA1p31-related protein n=1 Tax=Streptomyces asiaticus TaxID=114695 RepID=UPI001BA8D574|nr:phiSA1p31-related protein [Streptomyces asiaticus]